MILLALDSSRESQSVTISELAEANIIATKYICETDPEVQKNTRQQKSSQYLPLVVELFNENKIKPSDIGLIAVSTGPGSFTGVRTAITVAKTLASQLNLEIFAANNFELLRFEQKLAADQKLAIKAGKNDYFISFDDDYQNSKTNFFDYQVDDSMVKKFNELNLSKILANYVFDLKKSSQEDYQKHVLDFTKVEPYYLREPTIGKIHPKANKN